MFKKPKPSPLSPTVWLVGLPVSIAGLLLAVSSMEYEPITLVKLLIAVLCLVCTAVCIQRLNYKQTVARRRAARLALVRQQKKQQENIAA